MSEFDFSLVKIKQITALETFTVRHPILRKGRSIEDCKLEGDDLKTTFHFGLFHKDNLVAVATFLKNNNSLLSSKFQYQLRGMAVLDEYQGKNLGSVLLRHGEEFLKKEKVEILWCNARKTAKKFYTKRDYRVIGEPFKIHKIGLHYTMFKQVTNP